MMKVANDAANECFCMFLIANLHISISMEIDRGFLSHIIR